MITNMRLVLDSEEMSLWDRDDLWVTSFEVAHPEVREAVADRTDTDGTDDTTAFHGSAAVSLALRLQGGTDSSVLDELKRFMHPRSRPLLVVADDEWDVERRLRLRINQGSSPFQMPMYPVARDVQMQWVAPDGAWESSAELEVVIAADGGALAGRTYALAPPRTYPATMPAGAVLVVNPGNTWQHQKAKLYGPCAGPRYTCEDTGETLSFTEDLVLAAGEYVEIDTAARTALLNSDPDASRLNYLDFGASTWWRLPPGTSSVRYHPISGVDAGCVAIATYRPAWL